jgi:cytochrome b involved in lipid metabolism
MVRKTPPQLHELYCQELQELRRRYKNLPGTDPSRPTLVAIKGSVFDVSKNAAYAPGGQYHGMYHSADV